MKSRAYAHTHNLPNKDRKDSQGICFLGSFKFRDFIAHHVGIQKGAILLNGKPEQKVGTHDGFWFYTIGQRQGLGLGGGPWYVIQKEPATNTVLFLVHYYSDDKVRDQFTVHTTQWLSDKTSRWRTITGKTPSRATLS